MPISNSGFLITEDFGSAGVIEGDPPRPIVECYEAATDMLAELHRKALPKRRRWRRRARTKFRSTISMHGWSRSA